MSAVRSDMRWYDVAIAAQHRLDGYEGDMDGAEARLEGLSGSKADLLKAVAYLALQVQTYRAISNEDATLALTQIRSTLAGYDEARKGSISQTPVSEEEDR